MRRLILSEARVERSGNLDEVTYTFRFERDRSKEGADFFESSGAVQMHREVGDLLGVEP